MSPTVLAGRMRISYPGRTDGSRMTRIRAVLIVTLVVSMFLAACSSSGSGPGGETTCREWLDLDDNLSAQERLMEGKVNEEQQEILKRMLDAHGKDTGEMNQVNAEWAIIQFCGPDGTGTRPNIHQPIEDAIDW